MSLRWVHRSIANSRKVPSIRQLSTHIPMYKKLKPSLGGAGDSITTDPHIAALPARRVLLQNDHYLVIDKPPYVRMDGDFPCTVETLVHRHLVEAGVQMTKEIRPRAIHQLDYATSGVLTLGLTREATDAACRAFENRETEKRYMAVLNGHLDTSQWPEVACSRDERLEASEQEEGTKAVYSAKEARKLVDETQSWQHDTMRATLKICTDALSSLQPASGQPLEKDKELVEFQSHTFERYATNSKLRKQLRKFLKSRGVDLGNVEEMNEQAMAQNRKEEAAAGLPNIENGQKSKIPMGEQYSAVFLGAVTKPMLERNHCVTRIPTQSKDAFISTRSSHAPLLIRIPIAEISGEFRVEVGHENNLGRFAETILEVVEYATYQGKPVTKVLLKPLTGRRHQLRVHCLSLGHPIVGDATYEEIFYADLARNERANASTSSGIKRRADVDEEEQHEIFVALTNPDSKGCKMSKDCESERAERMMLHALELKIPLHSAYRPRRASAEYFKSMHATREKSSEKVYLVDVHTCDPFPVVEGSLNILHY